MKIRLFLLALCSVIAFQIQTLAQATDTYTHRLESVIIDNQVKTVFEYNPVTTALIKKTVNKWKDGDWKVETVIEYQMDETTKTNQLVSVTTYDDKGNSAKKTITSSIIAAEDVKSIDKLIAELKDKSGGENSNPTNGEWND